MDVEVVIEGVLDAGVEHDIKRTIHEACNETSRSGEWTVVVSPSETRGQWDLGVRGPSGHHFASFTEGAERLPALVAGQLRAWLQRTGVAAT